MKRVLLIAIVAIFSVSLAQAQIIQSTTEKRTIIVQEPTPVKKVEKKYPDYQGEFNVGYVTMKSVNFELVNGVRVNDYLFAGVGLGVKYAGEITFKWKEDKTYDALGTDLLFIPLYLNLKGYYPVTEKFHPYLNLSLGYGIAPEEVNDGEFGGFYSDFGIGFNVKAFNFGIGLQHQAFKIDDEWDDENYKFINNSFYIKLGFKW